MKLAGAMVVAALLAAHAGDAHAAAEGEHGPSFFLLGIQILNFAVLLFLLYRYARKPVLGYLAERSRFIRHAIEAADARLREAEAELAGLRSRLEGFDDEARALVARAAEQAEIERQHHIERARAAAERIREDARRVSDREIERARLELRAEAAELATELAAQLLRDRVTPDDDRRLVREFVERVERST